MSENVSIVPVGAGRQLPGARRCFPLGYHAFCPCIEQFLSLKSLCICREILVSFFVHDESVGVNLIENILQCKAERIHFHCPFNSISMPMMMNPEPARIDISLLGTKVSIRAPAKTARSVASVRARDAARKTRALEWPALEAKSMVASCVLSPILAKNTVKKMVKNTPRRFFCKKIISQVFDLRVSLKIINSSF